MLDHGAGTPSTTERPELFAVGRYSVGDQLHDLPCTYGEIVRDSQHAERMLAALGVEDDAFVVIVGMYSEAPALYPFQEALRRLGVPWLCVDDTENDAVRLLAALDHLPVQGMLGLGSATHAGLLAHGPTVAERIASLRFVAARLAAHHELEQAGVASAVRITMLGPAMSLECRPGAGLHVDPSEWSLATDGGEILVTNLRLRGVTSDRRRTALHGMIDNDPCSCDLPGPRVVPVALEIPS